MRDEATVRDVMSREFVGVSESDAVVDVVEVVLEERADCVVVLRGSEPVGVVVVHDLLEFVIEENRADEPIDTLMRPPPEPIDAESGVDAAIDRLSTSGIGLLPVADGERDLVGVVSASDLVAAVASLLSAPERGFGDDPLTPESVASEQAAAAAGDAARDPAATDEYSTQGVCESCGTLTGELRNFNGQLICSDCRNV